MDFYRNRHSIESWLAIVAVVLCSFATSAHAQDDKDKSGDDGEPKINASKEFARANRLASAGAITRSIPHYEKVLRAAPDKYPLAYFNLAEVYRFKEECAKSLLLYQAFMAMDRDVQNQSEAKAGIAKCTQGKKTGTLTVTASPQDIVRLQVDGYVVSRNGKLDEFELLPGDYTVRASAKEHTPKTEQVTIEEGKAAKAEFELVEKLFHGTVEVIVDQKGATIALTPKELDSPRAPDKKVTLTSPMKEPHKLPTGKYFLEVTKDDYNRWIRNIYVKRDEKTVVDVRMSEALPEAIRR